jgi:hypothetical protein
MISQQTPARYYSLRGLEKFLTEKFGTGIDFNICAMSDGYFTFEAPASLTSVSQQAQLTSWLC